MGDVFCCYVKEKPSFVVGAEYLFGELRHILGLAGLTNVWVLHHYDVKGVDVAVYAAVCTTALFEPQVDALWDEVIPASEGEYILLTTEALPGQCDQWADSCAQCVQMMYGREHPTVRAATVYMLKGALTTPGVTRAWGYPINPVKSREAALDKPATLRQDYPVPAAASVPDGFTILDHAGLESILAQYALAMDLADLTFLQAYFQDEEGRDLTLTGVRMVDTYWSGHCRHTTFSTHLDAMRIADDSAKTAYERHLSARMEVHGAEKAAKRSQTLMDIVTLGAKTLKKQGLLPELDEDKKINTCSIHVPTQADGKEQDWLFIFKNETHDHLVEIKPFGGAAACIGGCIRDPLSGWVYAHQAIHPIGYGDPCTPAEQTLEGRLPQRRIAQTAAVDYSSYGNQIDLATGHMAEPYHEGYAAKHLERDATAGTALASSVRRERLTPGDVVILLGGRIGRDGVDSAIGSSKSRNEASLDTMVSEVQRGNAPEKRKLQRLFRDPAITRLIKRCNGLDADDVSVVIGELVDGLSIDLDAVRKKYNGLNDTELTISESQERMAVTVVPADVDVLLAAAARENLETYPMASVTVEPHAITI